MGWDVVRTTGHIRVADGAGGKADLTLTVNT